MEVVLQNQDFRSIEIMENDLRFQKNEVCDTNIIIYVLHWLNDTDQPTPETRLTGLATSHATNLPRPRARLKKVCLLQEPIRLHD